MTRHDKTQMTWYFHSIWAGNDFVLRDNVLSASNNEYLFYWLQKNEREDHNFISW